MEKADESADIAVLREMVRLAENRRVEQLQMMERINQYNLGIIAFSGSFLSLLITIKVPSPIFYVSGCFALLAIGTALWTIRPQTLKGGTLLIADDIASIRRGEKLSLSDFLLTTSELTEHAANAASKRAHLKKQCTIIAVFFLAISLLFAYSLYAYA
ncbi:MAG TPA: hypothetical protein VHA78_05130 [Candidatus Peribacteraceae bacterium]|nr:hypothetical protein [Candidatus Peribacteraceae bacterium]